VSRVAGRARASQTASLGHRYRDQTNGTELPADELREEIKRDMKERLHTIGFLFVVASETHREANEELLKVHRARVVRVEGFK
jgi:hypothetical protein